MEKAVHAHVPRNCEYDGAQMDNTESGARCPSCGHEVFDEEFDFFGAPDPGTPAAKCQCAKCAGK